MSLLEKSSSIEIDSQESAFTAKRNTYSLGQKVQIEVQVDREYIDFQNSYLKLKAVFGASTDALHNPWFAGLCVRNLRVKTLGGQQMGNEINEYRAWYQMVMELSSNSDFVDSYGEVMEGAKATALADAGSTIQFSHKFMAHIFSVAEYYPAHFHQGLMIEFDLPQNINELCYEATNTGDALPATLTFEDIEYVARLVQVKPEIENEMVALMEQGQLFVDYMEVLTQQNDMAAQSGAQNYDIIGIDGRVRSINTYTIQDADRDGDEEAYYATWGLNNLSSYRYKLGPRYLNYEAIEVGSNTRAEQTAELLKSLDLYDNNKLKYQTGNSALTPALLETNRFATGYRVAKSQKKIDQTISSSIDKDRNNVRVELNFSSAPTVGTIYTHITVDKRLQLLPGSVVRTVRS